MLSINGLNEKNRIWIEIWIVDTIITNQGESEKKLLEKILEKRARLTRCGVEWGYFELRVNLKIWKHRVKKQAVLNLFVVA
jgi:hypothetical protein